MDHSIAENSDSLKLEIDEVLNEAIMSNTAIILVEGIDDIPIYEELLCEAIPEKECEIYAIENVDGYHEGCRGVLDCVKELFEQNEKIDITRHILGIIDRDARFYRGETKEHDALLILSYYSIESHFITKEALSLILRQITRTSSSFIDDDDINLIFDEICSHLHGLYLISIEALKNACDANYDACLGYSSNLTEIRNKGLDKSVINKAESLNKFASAVGVANTWSDLLKICKGKWIFSEFAATIKKQLSTLPNRCKDGDIKKCQFCQTGSYDKCLYKPTYTANDSIIKNLILRNHHVGELDYIKDRAARLK
ncbi:DUF4435 domain-containing protein [Aeromonas salmonicida]|uniref:DUF4435 domain-containing protein n=1 Tax=Aeromonas salmonicida TaxID=645 RepID=UPI0024A8A721|nr:DUF4435 domain-containing protein [Aeromonas salmonicida]MDM5135422.1 DUF4435 domain-containing protein [Aeromonas salmonicida]MDQ1883040.1 DUF4435 domain-containing protein [Aeromonas salmonicida]WHF41525.1 DUF4435 domain-containing protein [Aeromonas salmonicida]